MSLPARFTPLARADLRDALVWIGREQPAAARAFGAALRQAAVRIGAYPGIGALRPGFLSPGQRLLALPPWPYLIVYREGPSRPRILRLLHGARDLPPLLRDAAEP